MKPKICLLKCPSITLPYPPDLAVGYIVATLKGAGYTVRSLDLNWSFYFMSDAAAKSEWLWTGEAMSKHRELGDHVFKAFYASALRQIDQLLADGFRVFGFSVWDLNRENSLVLARLIKQRAPDAVVIFGGPECMPLWSGDKFILEPCIDAVAFGEAEETVVELIRSLELFGELRPCAGAYVRTAAGVVKGEGRPVSDPAALAFPDYSDYYSDFDVSKMDRRIAIAFNRGCVWKCKFCSVPGYIPKFRWRPAEQIFAEMEHQVGRYGTKTFYESSPTANSNLKEMLKLCDLISERKLNVEWMGMGIFHPGLDLAAIQRMRKGGCETMSFGMESGSQRVLDLMGKKFKLAHAERVLRDMKSVGIRAGMGLIVGYPGETEEDFQETLGFIKRNAENIGFVGSVSSMAMGDPYAPIFEEDEARGIVDKRLHTWSTRDGSSDCAIREDRRKRAQDLAVSLGLYTQKHPAPDSFVTSE